jgi:hypothetical protein
LLGEGERDGRHREGDLLHGVTSSAWFGDSPKVSGAYNASARVGGS